MTAKEWAEIRQDALRLRVGLLKRPYPRVPHMTKFKYAKEIRELDEFAHWVVWNEEGRQPPRPLNIRAKVPRDWYIVYDEYKKKHHPKPPPSTVPPVKIPDVEAPPAWLNDPGICVSWGMQAEEGRGFNSLPSEPNAFAVAVAGYKIKRVSLQAIPDNDKYADATRKACHAHGLGFDIWTNVPQAGGNEDDLESMLDRIESYQPDNCQFNWEFRPGLGGTILEDPAHVNNCHRIFVMEYKKRFPRTPFCPQTNFGGFELREAGTGKVVGYDRAAASIWIEGGARCCQHEDYIGNNPRLTPANGDFGAINQLGFPSASSLLGPFPSETGQGYQPTIAQYVPLMAEVGRRSMQWAWTAEYMTREDLIRLGQPI